MIHLGLGLRGAHVFAERGKDLGELTDDILTIYAGYTSDGASPHLATICGIRIGTYSGRKTAPGWWPHDFMYQFGPDSLPCCPWTFDQADDVLYWMMRQNGSILGGPYHAALSIFGGLHRQLTRPRNTEVYCRHHPHP